MNPTPLKNFTIKKGEKKVKRKYKTLITGV
jgi:hypothetical protein